MIWPDVNEMIKMEIHGKTIKIRHFESNIWQKNSTNVKIANIPFLFRMVIALQIAVEKR